MKYLVCTEKSKEKDNEFPCNWDAACRKEYFIIIASDHFKSFCIINIFGAHVQP
jgi:hypothetical protein